MTKTEIQDARNAKFISGMRAAGYEVEFTFRRSKAVYMVCASGSRNGYADTRHGYLASFYSLPAAKAYTEQFAA